MTSRNAGLRAGLDIALGVASRLPGARADRAAFAVTRQRLDAASDPADASATIARLVRRADAALARSDQATAAEFALKAQLLTFHPRHLDAVDPERSREGGQQLLAPLRTSRTGALLHGPIPTEHRPTPDAGPRPAGDLDRSPAAPRGPQEPLRVLVVAYRNFTFIDRVITELERPAGPGEPHVQVEKLDLVDVVGQDRLRLGPLTEERLRVAFGGRRTPAPEALRDALGRHDVVLCEWGNQALAHLSLIEGIGAVDGGVPLVAHVHRYELETAFPYLADTSRVDRWVFAAEHIGRRAHWNLGVAPHRSVTIGNVNDLTRFTAAKTPEAPRTLLHVSWSREVKDVHFALDVLEQLRRQDPAWRLQLVDTPPSAASASPEIREALRRVERSGEVVEVLGRRTDMEQVLQGAGFVLSTSRSEGTHEIVVEGAAAACVPVVRDWPQNRASGGAGTVYPADWIVADREAAVARVLEHADPGVRTTAGQAAREHVLGDPARDPRRIRGQVVDVLLDAVAARAH